MRRVTPIQDHYWRQQHPVLNEGLFQMRFIPFGAYRRKDSFAGNSICAYAIALQGPIGLK